jgi:hypothetical protein
MKIHITAALLATAAAVYFWPQEKVEEPALVPVRKTLAEPAKAEAAIRSPASTSAAIPVAEAKLSDTPLNESERKSISALVSLISRPEEVGKSPRALFDALGQAGLKPVAAKDSNGYTGTLWTVRTDNALPGTRYFHAQLFGEGETHMQHVSFEIRPGADSMDAAIELVRQANPDLSRPEIDRADYVLWKKQGGKVISVRRLNAEELRDSRFNAHAPEDEGTIWVTSEDEPSHELAQY